MIRPTNLPALMALAVVIVFGIFADYQNHQVFQQNLRASVLAEVSVIRAKLEGHVNANLQLVRGLIATIATEPDMSQERFDQLASKLFEEESQLRSIAAAPNLIVTMTYPLKGNERAIGLNYRTNETQRDAALRVMETGKLVLAGPVELVQGGRGFIGRFPVYVGDTLETRMFWGLVSAVIDVERLYHDSGLLDEDLDIEIGITGQDSTGLVGDQFFGRAGLFADDPVLTEVILPSGSWAIGALPKGAGAARLQTPGCCAASWRCSGRSSSFQWLSVASSWKSGSETCRRSACAKRSCSGCPAGSGWRSKPPRSASGSTTSSSEISSGTIA